MTEPSPFEKPLSGQVALVTGASRGIGREIAQTLATAGASVALVARSEDQLTLVAESIRGAGGAAHSVVADVTDSASVDRAAASITATLGHVDLLVNNAGSAAGIGQLWKVDPDLWWHDIVVNLRGPSLWCQRLLPDMLGRRRGRIVNIVSNSALTPHAFNSGYGASKAALAHLTASLAAEVESMGLAVFALSPGSVRTDLSTHVVQALTDEGLREDLNSRLTWTTPERAARAVVFLASGDADGLSGRFIHVDDDLADLASRAEEVRGADTHRLVRKPLPPPPR